MHHIPSSLLQNILTCLINYVEGKLPTGLKPKHKLLEASLPIRGDFLEKVKVGLVQPHKAGIEKFTSDSLILTNGTKLNVDAVVFCTGYNIDYPYLPLDSYLTKNNTVIDALDNPVNLFELVVPPNYQNLFFIGLIESPGPNAQIFETQARWAVGVLSGTISLPNPEEMMIWTKKFATRLAGRAFTTPKAHIRVSSNVSYIDRLTKPLHANPSLTRLLRQMITSNPFRAFSVLYSVYAHVTSSSQFRLFGNGACHELATATILRIAGDGKKLSHDEKIALQQLKVEWIRKGEHLVNGVESVHSA
jgi:dimethylaniline monooxygenase (N-oxide forming)